MEKTQMSIYETTAAKLIEEGKLDKDAENIFISKLSAALYQVNPNSVVIGLLCGGVSEKFDICKDLSSLTISQQELMKKIDILDEIGENVILLTFKDFTKDFEKVKVMSELFNENGIPFVVEHKGKNVLINELLFNNNISDLNTDDKENIIYYYKLLSSIIRLYADMYDEMITISSKDEKIIRDISFKDRDLNKLNNLQLLSNFEENDKENFIQFVPSYLSNFDAELTQENSRGNGRR